MAGTLELTPALGLAAACRAMGLWRGAPGRHKARAHRTAFVGPPSAPRPARPRSSLALSEVEQTLVLQALCSERFCDTAPAAVHATLLDEGSYLGSVRTMYRLLAANASSAERRRQRSHPAYAKPELLALAPNQVWSWDITKLKGPAKWTCFHLYVILDIFSRYVVGWLIAPRESAELAQQLIADTVARHDVMPGALTLHADRGTSMRSKPVASLLIDLDVAKSHSRPYISDDNPYSESQFKTMKYRPDFPQRFGSIEDARCQMPLPNLLCLIQQPALPFRHWPHDTLQRALRASTGHAQSASSHAECGICRHAQPIQGHPPLPETHAHCGLDQPTTRAKDDD